MSNPTIKANIYEENDGPYFEVLLHSIPRIGELINLYSFLDASTNHPPYKHYEVVQVIHQISDVSEKIELSKNGSHFYNILVKHSSSENFQ